MNPEKQIADVDAGEEGAANGSGAASIDMSFLSVLKSGAVFCAPALIVALALLKFKFAAGTVAGLLFCVMMYMLAREIVVRVVSLASRNHVDSREVDGASAKGAFLFFIIAKFFVIGLLLYIILLLLHADLAGFITGFLLSQIGVTVFGARQLSRKCS